jgi:quercetin dioxygenase-like cupin family protein
MLDGALAAGLVMTGSELMGLPHVSKSAVEDPPSKEHHMQITSNSPDTATGPREWFTGSVYIDALAAATGPSRLQAASVHFTPGARTAWHTHPFGQTIYVTEGVGRCQRRGGAIEVIRGGDRVHFEPGEEHWHGAAPNRFMTHLAMQEVDDEGNPATWGEHVSDEEYNAAPTT